MAGVVGSCPKDPVDVDGVEDVTPEALCAEAAAAAAAAAESDSSISLVNLAIISDDELLDPEVKSPVFAVFDLLDEAFEAEAEDTAL